MGPRSARHTSYDEHGRQAAVIDARNGATTYAYNAADLVTSVTSPPPGTGAPAQVTSTAYDRSLRATNIVYADGGSLTNEYLPSGLLSRVYGSRTYPVGYGYDAQGRMTRMTNWSGFAAGSGARVTVWNYHATRGWLANKRYPDSTGPDYTYTLGGRLLTRQWARGTPRLSTTYSYNGAGELVKADYSDSTPDVVYVYNRLGQQTRVDQGANRTLFTLTLAGQRLVETNTLGVLAGTSVTNSYDTALRRSALRFFRTNVAAALTVSYGYDTAGRLSTVGDGAAQATYGYLANSALVEEITFRQSGTQRMKTTRQYDRLNRLTSVASAPSGANQFPVGFAYQYNDANQRVRATLADGSFWVYEYDRLGQVVSGKRYWIDGTPVPGQQFEYGFDDIGNRGSASWGGNSAGTGLRSALYTNNTLNQLTGRGVPGGFDVMGIAHAGASVTVNSSPADYRRGEYFQEAVSVANTTSPVWQNVAVTASQGGSSSNWPAGSVFVPRTGELFGHDTDGNLTSDGRWAYTWDGENRLVRMVANTAVGPQQRLDFEYDWQGRRIRKVVWPNTGGTGTTTANLLFVYDGWNLVAELNATNKTVIRSYVWGLDLSGSEQGAGGVGGLLAVKPGNGMAQFAAYDGNGNVTALVDGTTGTYTARYEYGPFGEPIRVSGTHGSANPFRFSTKFTDDETGLMYYGFRYYNPITGRWVNRDPIGEKGGSNLYGFVGNSSVNRIDLLGAYEYESSIDMFLEFWFGRGRGGGVSDRMVDDVLNSSIVQIFSQGLLAEGRGFWKCGTTKDFLRTVSLEEFNPANDMKWYSAAGLDWILTGNWQLYLKGRCTAKCNPCADGGRCKCYTRCRIDGDLSKLYTFVYVGGNPANIATTPFAVLLPTETYRIHEHFILPALDVGYVGK
jgi:RHS repeat-associated protein